MSTTWHPDDLIGRQLGSCVLERPLGIGGMGAVYLARQQRPHRQVAVKLVRPQPAGDPRSWQIFLARFRREADATAALDHANIMPIYEFGEDDQLAYLVMPYLPDGSLAGLLAREGALSWQRVASYLEQAAAALDCAHSHGIIHRDVKPSNLLLHPDGRLLLADFGIARPMQYRELLAPAATDDASIAEVPGAELTLAGVAMGTPDYMAPEQIRGEELTPATDLYALGTVGYALLCGHTPFGGEPPERIFARQLSEAPAPIAPQAPSVPPQMARAILWAMAKDPAQRPQNARAFARAVRGGRAALAPATGGFRTLASFAPGAAAATGTLDGMAARASNDAAPARLDTARPVAPDDATIVEDALYGAPAIPVWPGAGAGSGARPPSRARQRGARPLLGCLAILLVVAALALLVNGVAGSLLATTGSGSPAATQSALSGLAHTATTPLPSPTATNTPTPVPTNTPVPPPENWLQASPAAIHLGCKGPKSSATVMLSNLGPQPVDWMAQPSDAGIQITPLSGTVAPGQNAPIQVRNTSLFFGHQGVIQFTAMDPGTGQPATVSYTVDPCGY